MQKNIIGKNALVTGASRGIGKIIATALAREGCNLLITGRDSRALAGTAEELLRLGGKVFTQQVDFLEEDAPDTVVRFAEDCFAHLDILINNAGTAYAGTIEEATIKDWNDLMNLNARAPFFLTIRAIPLMKKAEDPAIINMSSVVGYRGYENQAIYSASKHALSGWSKAAAKELSPQGIRLHLISPGGTATELISRMRPDINPDDLIQPEAIAETVLYLLKLGGNAVVDEINIHRAANIPWK
jgi:3-oxoacyl-[acyl-carrier protein] reductase